MMKRLVEKHPQDFVSWLHKGAHVEGILKQELQQTVYADSLIKIRINGQPGIAHFEFQTIRDPHMGERLLLYNILASRANDHLPVWSHVIYLRPDNTIEEPPFQKIFPDKREIFQFHYDRIELWTMTAEELLAIPLDGLLPLTLLTRDGTEPDRIEQMFQKLGDRSVADKELVSVTYTLGGLVFKEQEKQDWFKRRFHMYHDILEESWTYQEMKKEIEEKVTPQVEARVREEMRTRLEAERQARLDAEVQARLEAERQAHLEADIRERIEREIAKVKSLQRQMLRRARMVLVGIVEKRFPSSVRFVQGMSNAITNLDVLDNLIVDVSTAQTAEEVTSLVVAAVERMAENEDEQDDNLL